VAVEGRYIYFAPDFVAPEKRGARSVLLAGDWAPDASIRGAPDTAQSDPSWKS
jgi:hypothetical protein